MAAVNPAQTTTTPENLTRFRVLGAISFSHFINDMLQSLLLAIYPILKGSFHLSFAQIGLVTFTYQVTASLLQPIVGAYTDKHPKPYSLVFGMTSTMIGIILLAFAPNYAMLLVAALFMGTGSSIFHPESSRVARLASGGKHGLAQSIFQVGGNVGSAVGPLLAALFIVTHGQKSTAWFAFAALMGMIVLWKIGGWYKEQQRISATQPKTLAPSNAVPQRQVIITVAVLMGLIFSKFFYLTSLTSYYTFYLMDKFHLSIQSAQVYLFIFLGSVAAGTILGGPIGDRIGRKQVIWVSILGIAPFTLALPYMDLMWTSILSVIIGFTLASAFPAIIVFAQEVMPNKVGMVSGLFFGFAFGMGGIGAAVLGQFADLYGIGFVYRLCAFLPLLGLLAIFLPNMHQGKSKV
jgi:FSR family fosmidomycin resistance protein-like MFS transporter